MLTDAKYLFDEFGVMSDRVSVSFQNFSVEIMLETRGELDLETIRARVDKVGGSVYGTGGHH